MLQIDLRNKATGYIILLLHCGEVQTIRKTNGNCVASPTILHDIICGGGALITQAQKDSVFRFIRSLKTRSFTFRDIVRFLDLESEERRSLQHYLDELDSEGIIHKAKRGQYSLPTRESLISGVLTCHRDGYGFVTPDDKSQFDKDIFIPPRNMEEALHGDRVLIKVARKTRSARHGLRGRRGKGEQVERIEGTVVRVVERKMPSIVGRFYEHPRFPFMTPLDSRIPYDILIPFHASKGAEDGQIVVATLTRSAGRNQQPQGQVIEILGYPDDSGIEYKIVERKYGLLVEFSRDALQEVEQIPGHISAKDCLGREDFRADVCITIDGETARDFDDAVSLKELANGHYLLGVHIADVSHYVQEGSALDKDAYARGTSVYFPDRSIPMLPHNISSGICSLKPGEDRLVFSVLMEVDGKGNVVQSRFVEGVLRSKERMTYTSIAKILLEKDQTEMRRYAALGSLFEEMEELCLILSQKRRRKGAVDFDLPEAEIEFDSNGKVISVVQAERNIAHRIIEEFMLLANETVARKLTASGGPALFRIHEKPDARKVDEFAEFALTLGYKLEHDLQEYRPMDFQKFVAKLEGKIEGRFLAYLMLRSFMQARYSEKNLGHFGLATREYTHFTSPIRRYPDLFVHRLLKECLKPEPSKEWQAAMKQRLPDIASHTSSRERVANEAEREIEKIKMAQFMAGKVGDEFEAIVFSVTKQGFFVELLDHFIEGFVPVATLIDDRYVYRDRTHSFVGERRRKHFELGKRVQVRLDRADLENYRLTFSPV
jgi:ribonuclease R